MGFDVENAARLLADARRQHRQLTPFSPGPPDAQAAYAVQDRIAGLFGPVGGWKVGAKAPPDMPIAAPLFADLVRPSPAEWPAGSLHMIGIEAELAFRVGRDVPARREPLSDDEIWGSIASMHAAVEIVDTRLATWKDADRLWVLSDNQSNGGFVYDRAGLAVPDGPLAEAQVRLVLDGKTVIDGVRANPAGDPRRLVAWLVNHCALSRGGLREGMFITTGSYTGMPFVEPGASVEARFDGIGAVSVSFL